jgi:ABC-type Mn2+/Zn2+ transport system ATPase subunit
VAEDNDARTPAHLEIDGVTLAYGNRTALRGVTFQVPEGTRLAVVGPNGAGKSSLFKALVRLLPVRAGSIRVHGAPLGAHRDCVAYVPQREEVDWRFPVTVLDVVMMGRYGHLGWLQRPGRRDRAVALRCLEQVGMSRQAGRSIGDLSGGQQQRIFLARALAQEPHILLMDEPFTGVDVNAQEAMLGVLDGLRGSRVTVMIATHDLGLASTRFDQVVLLNRRLVASGRPAEVFTPAALAEAFGGQALILPGGAVVADQCCPPPEPADEAAGAAAEAGR